MIISGYTINFISYAVPLLLISGFVLIKLDAGGNRKQGNKTEYKLSLVLGWTNVVLGVFTYILRNF